MNIEIKSILRDISFNNMDNKVIDLIIKNIFKYGSSEVHKCSEGK